ncbi:TetR/AcrR family transcriptional regulator [Crenobacter sp. SG2305]|uniref:TetR/AcrR family transcriptional regulator n=1 Tax=Crenobacter oryzisoli TaxID=3056844 RepID=UPI0025AB0039|nr:TetR/AcrR family transcriptional regulator [Crenobacter sp. SG2305]MDN0083302.1 TetR/AcrR family transcriptional regulator [Crenobacter sp. SG2305]
MSQAQQTEPINHRTLVGRQRRERTRQKILNAALKVFALKGPEAPVIEDFIVEAGIARGTFYNYFRTTQELLQATLEWLSADLITSIETEIGDLSDSVLRLTTGMRLWLGKAELDPTWAAFFARPECIDQLPFGPVFAPVMQDLRNGHTAGLFQFTNERVAFDLIAGILVIAMRSHISGRTYPGYADDIVRITLQGLGVTPTRIEAALSHPLPALRRTPMSMSSS